MKKIDAYKTGTLERPRRLSDARVRSRIKINGPSRTQKEFRDECNINNIMARYKTKNVVPVKQSIPVYGDFTNAGDFKLQQDRVIAAKRQFDQLPAETRERFHNRPEEMIEFLSSEENIDEARELGLVKPEKEVSSEEKMVNELRGLREDLRAEKEPGDGNRSKK